MPQPSTLAPQNPRIQTQFAGRDEWVLGAVVLVLVGLMVWMNTPTPDIVVDVTPVISRRQSWLPAVPKENEVPPAVYGKALAKQLPQASFSRAHPSTRSAKFATKALPPLASVDINRASVKQLEALPQVGPKLAQRIVAFRKQQGAFTSIDALDEVKGVGPKLLSRIRPYLKPIPTP